MEELPDPVNIEQSYETESDRTQIHIDLDGLDISHQDIDIDCYVDSIDVRLHTNPGRLITFDTLSPYTVDDFVAKYGGDKLVMTVPY